MAPNSFSSGAAKAGKGGGEGAFVMALTDMSVNALIPLGEWFAQNRSSLYVVIGTILAAVVHTLASKYLWRS